MNHHIAWFQHRDKMVITDTRTNGTLDIKFSPMSLKRGSDLMWGTINDISSSLKSGELVLNLKGHSVIEVRSDIELKGEVTLKTAFLHDPVIEDCHLDFVSITAKTVLKRTKLHAIGRTGYGLLTIHDSEHDGFLDGAIPKGREVNIINNEIKVVMQ